MLKEFPNLKEAYDFYQNFILSISKNDVAMLEDILNTRTDEIPMCIRNFKARIMLMERYKIQNGNIHESM